MEGVTQRIESRFVLPMNTVMQMGSGRAKLPAPFGGYLILNTFRFRAHGNENWEFDELGYMTRREASINDIPIQESERVIAIDGPPQTKDNPKWT